MSVSVAEFDELVRAAFEELPENWHCPVCNADNHGDTWDDGPQCCAGGCGVGTDGFLPVICNGSKQAWECQGSGVPAEACASFRNACNTMDGCHILGLGTEEPDPVPELCFWPWKAAGRIVSAPLPHSYFSTLRVALDKAAVYGDRNDIEIAHEAKPLAP